MPKDDGQRLLVFDYMTVESRAERIERILSGPLRGKIQRASALTFSIKAERAVTIEQSRMANPLKLDIARLGM